MLEAIEASILRNGLTIDNVPARAGERFEFTDSTRFGLAKGDMELTIRALDSRNGVLYELETPPHPGLAPCNMGHKSKIQGRFGEYPFDVSEDFGRCGLPYLRVRFLGHPDRDVYKPALEAQLASFRDTYWADFKPDPSERQRYLVSTSRVVAGRLQRSGIKTEGLAEEGFLGRVMFGVEAKRDEIAVSMFNLRLCLATIDSVYQQVRIKQTPWVTMVSLEEHYSQRLLKRLAELNILMNKISQKEVGQYSHLRESFPLDLLDSFYRHLVLGGEMRCLGRNGGLQIADRGLIDSEQLLEGLDEDWIEVEKDRLQAALTRVKKR